MEGRIGRLAMSVALAFGAATVLAASGARAAPAWLSPVNVSEENSTEPQIAFDRAGDAAAVWGREGAYSVVMQAAFRPAGGTWHAPVDLSSCGQRPARCEPQITFDERGDAAVVWDIYTGSTFVVEAAFKPPGAPWETPVVLSPEQIPGASKPHVAFDRQGDAMAIWSRVGNGGVVQATFKPAAGAWQSPVTISEEGTLIDPELDVAFDAHGNALATWEQLSGGAYIVRAASRPAGGSWQAPVDVSAPGQTAEDPNFALDSHGDAVALWRRWTKGLFSYRIVQSAFKPAGGDWQTPVDVSAEHPGEPGNGAEKPAVAVDAQGNAIAVWTLWHGVQAAFKPSGKAWQSPVEISEPDENAYDPKVAFDGLGNGIAIWAWEPYVGANTVIQTAVRPAGGAWGSPVNLSEEGNAAHSAQIAFDGPGDAVAVWNHSSAGGEVVQAAGYVAAGPLLNGQSIPTDSIVGQPDSFSVSPLDVWSILGETSWSFGDGTSASGTTVTHVYTKPGIYDVTLHSADSLGNVTSTSAAITIRPASTSTTSSTSTTTPIGAPSSSSVAPSSAIATPPTISSVRESHRIWREGESLARISAANRPPIGTTFSLTLDNQASVRFDFTQKLSGRAAGDKCVAETTKNRGLHSCTRTVTRGILSFAGHNGKNVVSFRGRISPSNKLKPGTYTLVITAVNSAGASAPRSLSFTIAK